MALAGAFIVVLALLGLLIMLVRRKMSLKTARRIKALNASFTPINKAKILLSFYQLSTKVSVVYDVSLPADVNAFLESLTGFTSVFFVG